MDPEKLTTQEPRYSNRKLAVLAGAVLIAVIVYLLMSGIVSRNTSNTQQTNADRQTVLAAPTEGNLQSYEAAVSRLAVESNTLTIGTGCVMSPLVLKLQEGKALSIVNQDTADHTVAFEDQNFFNISAGTTRKLSLAEVFAKSEGIYRYRCSDISTSTAVGVIYIIK